MTPGTFFTFEGIEGSGKTTQVERLERTLTLRGARVVVFREPGGTDLSEAIRALLLRRAPEPPVPWAELCLYLASRAQLVAAKIIPALEDGCVVLADRFADASVAYQGSARGLGVRRVESLNRWVTGGLRPERVFLLDLDPTIGLERITRGRGAGSLDRIESEALAFHRAVRRAYLALARREGERYRVFDAARPADDVEARILSEVDGALR